MEETSDNVEGVDNDLSKAVNILISLNDSRTNQNFSDEENDSGWDTDLGSEGSSTSFYHYANCFLKCVFVIYFLCF